MPEDDLGWRQQRSMAGHGELLDMGSHRIDYAHYLVGEISAVSGTTRTFLRERRGRQGQPAISDVDDWAAFLAEFACGATGVFETSKLAKGRLRGGQAIDQVEINGTEGTLVFDLRRPHHLQLGKPRGSLSVVEVPKEWRRLHGSPWHPRSVDAEATYRFDQDFAFIQAALMGEAVTPSLAEAVRCHAVVEAVAESARRRAWVNVPAFDRTEVMIREA
jgi:predicted dehydrogenase